MNCCFNCDIAFMGKDCPLCEAQKQIFHLQEEIESMADEIKQLESKLDE